MKLSTTIFLRFFVQVTIVFIFGSCITDEFRFGDITVAEDWRMDIVSPVFSGKMEFRDFIHDWSVGETPLPGSKTTLDYSNRPDTTIETRLILDPSVIIDDYPFLIQGSYSFTSATLTFIVSNGSPLPLYLQLQFYDYKFPLQVGPPISPASFKEADFSSTPSKPYTTTHVIQLDDQQLASLNSGNRARFTSWYSDPSGYLNINHTLSAHYPVLVSIVLNGKAKPKE